MPTLQMCCGFGCGPFGATAGAHWAANQGVGGTFARETTIVRTTGSSGMRFTCAGNTASTNNLPASPFTGDRHIGRFYLYFVTLPSVNVGLGVYGQVGGPGISYTVSDSKIWTNIDGVKGATGVVVTTGQWYRIDYDYNVNVAGTDTCDLQVDGVACGQASGAGTSTSRLYDFFGTSVNATSDFIIADYTCSSTAADYPIGAGYCNHFIPTADGTHNVAGASDFEISGTGTDITNATTTAHLLVDDVPMKSGVVSERINATAPPNATDYVEVVYGPAPSIATPTVAPRGVSVLVAYASASAGTANTRLAVNDNGTTDDVVNTTTAPGTTAVYARKNYALAPTGGAWTVTAGAGNFNNLRMRFLTNDAAPDPWFASTMVEAEFAEVTPPEGRTTKNTRAFPLGTEIGMNWRGAA